MDENKNVPWLTATDTGNYLMQDRTLWDQDVLLYANNIDD